MTGADEPSLGGSRRSPLVVNVADLRRRVGERRPFAVATRLVDAGVGTARVSADHDVDVRLELEAVSGGISAVGEARGQWVGECRRCLEPLEGELVVQLDEVFEERPTEGETYPIDHDHVDLEPMIRESAILALPFGALCRDDCPGPAPDQFPVEIESDDEEPPARDPRWAVLDELRGDP